MRLNLVCGETRFSIQYRHLDKDVTQRFLSLIFNSASILVSQDHIFSEVRRVASTPFLRSLPGTVSNRIFEVVWYYLVRTRYLIALCVHRVSLGNELSQWNCMVLFMG